MVNRWLGASLDPFGGIPKKNVTLIREDDERARLMSIWSNICRKSRSILENVPEIVLPRDVNIPYL
jgi:hypothetical protein